VAVVQPTPGETFVTQVVCDEKEILCDFTSPLVGRNEWSRYLSNAGYSSVAIASCHGRLEREIIILLRPKLHVTVIT
jgi:hypothetical protein